MTDPEIRARHDLALEVAAEAGRTAHRFWLDRDRLVVEAKGGPQDVVSEADRTVERELRAAIGARFPDDGFLGEEYGLTPGRSGFTWVMDPIDGTSPYLHGMPNWCVALAILKGADCVAAVTEVPTHGETYAGIRGAGAQLNGKPLRIPGHLTMRSGITAIGASAYSDPEFTGRKIRELLEQGGMFFRNGSGALMLAYVAAGRLAGYFEPVMYPWDCLGGLMMIGEAGGQSLPLRHAPEDAARERVVAGAPGAWEEIRTLFGS
ncbi:inositol monophosphatase family protein [Rhodobacteraceae bacterium DSL-40]|uniref:inositol monophosphatase family protein n=1 Tax=Amaricoccus sp. B4 TaxID=3368557 RepID=UPI000DAEF40B